MDFWENNRVIPADFEPLIGLTLEKVCEKDEYKNLFSKLYDNHVGKLKLVKEIEIHAFDEKIGFYCARVKAGIDGKNISGVTGVSCYEALCKAIIEAYTNYEGAKKNTC